MTNVNSPFTPPPEAPVFEPTVEEFKDPLAYIAKIRHIAERSGICKIKPPPDWQPPFAVDVENFKFTPRVQRLNELEATTRIKLNFLDQIAKFWELQGSSLKIPNVERKVLDLFNLHRIVEEEGGMDYVTRERKWSRVATRMGFPAGRSAGAILRQHYERIVYPFEVFQSGNALEEVDIKEECGDLSKKDTDYIPHGIPSRQAIKPPLDRYGRRSKRCKESETETENEAESCDVDYSTNSELKKLQFYGAGPKMPGYSIKPKSETMEDYKIGSSPKGKDKKFGLKVDQIVCHNCGRGDEEACMLLCDGCDDSYHTFCLVPPLTEIPKGDWRCPRCVAEEVRKPKEAFGFEQAQREYTLQEFGEMADQFKSDYFNMPVHLVPLSSVEREFWRIVSAVDEDVTVEYGADLHTMDHGSGFPTKGAKDIIPGDEEYMNSGWNLNNLPVLNGSVFRHINADINGMKIPWTYVGMCFATFCWHNEDHWSYSINYLHWGEPKTWYGVPGDRAETFENAMKSAAPELFEAQPDLLHQLVTILNPNLLMGAGVPIVRTNQMAGEFVVTFPRSYHSGFNQGYNFAEAVNFAPADWLPVGRVCIAHYSMLHRFCVFSHDELVCKMAADPDRLDISLAASTYQDMLKMVESEKELRKALLEWGVTEAEREAFELLPDDERQCDYCKTTCFLSAVTCSCNANKLVCINHKNKLCCCPPEKHCLRYRYTLDELPVMLHRLKVRAESFDNWAVKVKNSLDATDDNKCELVDLKELIQEAEEKRFPKIDLLQTLISAVQEAEKCAAVAQQLLSRKVRTRNRQLGEIKHAAKLTLEDLQLFCQQICSLACEVKETLHIKDLLDRVLEFQGLAKEILSEETADIKKLEKLLDVGLGLDIDVPELPQLKQKLQQCRWLEEVRTSVTQPHDVTLEVLRKLLDAGVNLPPHPTVEKAMAELQELLTVGERWEEKAKLYIQAKPRHPLNALEVIVGETNDMPVYLPNVLAVKDAVKKGKEWSAKVDSIQGGEHYPYLDLLESLVNKGRPIPVRLDQLPHIESQVGAAKSWKERTARTFLKKNSPYALVEILSPRKEIGVCAPSKSKKKKAKESEKDQDMSLGWDLVFEEAKDPAAIVAAFKTAEQLEIESMRDLRIKNLRKRAEDNGDARYCVCRKGLTNYMLQCELCKDWFHANCVPLPKSTAIKKQQQQTSTSAALTAHLSKELKFLCPMCLRSRRPRLETILSLLVSLQKLPVRLPEGEALQCLTERAMSWQDRARQALATDELAAALAKLSVLSQRMVEQAAREKTEKIISTELMKAANNPELQPHLHVAQSAFSGLHSSSLDDKSISPPLPFGGMTEDMVPAVAAEQEVSLSDTLIMDVETTVETESDSNITAHSGSGKMLDGDNPSNYNNLEHAYSSASKTAAVIAGSVPRKHARKSPLVPRQLDSPVLELSDVAKAQLEELMMEGDLLEVSLDETQHIWRILQATKPVRDPLASLGPFGDMEEMDPRQMLFKAEKEKKTKKRKVQTDDGQNLDKSKPKEKNGLMKQPSLTAGSLESSKPKKKKIKKENELNICSSASSTTSNSSSSSSSSCSSSSSESGKCLIKKPLKVKIESSAMKVRRKALMADKKALKFNKDRMKQKLMEKRKMLKKMPQSRPGIHRTEKGKKGNFDEDEDEGEMCSAGKCLRPTGDAVNWVQCDGGCEQWFHLLCVGLSMNDVSENEDYICNACTKEEGIDVHLKVDNLTEAYACEIDSQLDVDSITLTHVTTDDSSQDSCLPIELETSANLAGEEVMLQVFHCSQSKDEDGVPIVEVDLSKLETTTS